MHFNPCFWSWFQNCTLDTAFTSYLKLIIDEKHKISYLQGWKLYLSQKMLFFQTFKITVPAYPQHWLACHHTVHLKSECDFSCGLYDGRYHRNGLIKKIPCCSAVKHFIVKLLFTSGEKKGEQLSKGIIIAGWL